MEKIRVLVVDDSRMSYAMIEGMLPKSDFEICGFAQTANDAVNKYQKLRPDIVTMDMNLPDYDGLQCSANILSIDPRAKIIMISAMRDAKLMTRGRAIGISSFLAKPVQAEKLVRTLKSQVRYYKNAAELYRESYVKPFVNTLLQNLQSLANLDGTVEILPNEADKLNVRGVAVIIGLTGYPMGRAVFYVAQNVMFKLAAAILGKAPGEVSEVEASECIEEIANIVSGQSVSTINDMYKEKELRITPPGTIMGNDMSIVNPRLLSFHVIAKTKMGDVNMSLGFAGGEQ